MSNKDHYIRFALYTEPAIHVVLLVTGDVDGVNALNHCRIISNFLQNGIAGKYKGRFRAVYDVHWSLAFEVPRSRLMYSSASPMDYNFHSSGLK